MKRIKFSIPISLDYFNAFRGFLEAVEWGYGDTYFLLGSDVVKLVEVKFREGVKPEEVLGELLEIPYVKDAKLIPKNGHYLLYVRANLLHAPLPENVSRFFEVQKRGMVIFEKGIFSTEGFYLYVVCEEGLLGDVISAVKEVYGARVVSVEDYTPGENPLLKLTGRQFEVLLLAYKSGYFDSPRRVTLRELSQMLGLSPSTVKEHLRKGLKRVLEEVVE
ncbi:helix-turn-helix domain-containing protein [Thermococcus gorgonarius]|uniref:Transcriptional regulator n=1 Tax=Thermococcus gorgonarius TaxID=71997 RepID=A0A2Z2M730_THEGO|nr:helix-turn-helix domain-containing protein [Thermococcus gorgonarius]ASJ01069.1 transcriptional regulator [Thermococcus gorgonarius]